MRKIILITGAILFVLIIAIQATSFFTPRGEKLLMNERYQDAVVEFKKELEKKPQAHDLYYNLAFAYLNMGEGNKAIQSFQQAFALARADSDKVFDRISLAAAQADTKMELAQAKKIIQELEQLIQQDPKRYHHYRIHIEMAAAWVYFQIGDRAKAMQYFNEAYPSWKKEYWFLDEDDTLFAADFYRNGVILNANDDQSGSAENLQKVLKCAPESIFARRARDLLEKIEGSGKKGD